MRIFPLLFLISFNLYITAMESEWTKVQHAEEKLMYEKTITLLSHYLKKCSDISSQCDKSAKIILEDLTSEKDEKIQEKIKLRNEGNRCLRCGEHFAVIPRYNEDLCKVCVMAFALILAHKKDTKDATFLLSDSKETRFRECFCRNIVLGTCPRCALYRRTYNECCTFCKNHFLDEETLRYIELIHHKEGTK